MLFTVFTKADTPFFKDAEGVNACGGAIVTHRKERQKSQHKNTVSMRNPNTGDGLCLKSFDSPTGKIITVATQMNDQIFHRDGGLIHVCALTLTNAMQSPDMAALVLIKLL